MAQIARIYNSNRVPLWTVIPLDTPFVIEVEPSSYCNMKCKYCLHSLSKNDIVDSGHKFLNMSDEIFELLLNQISQFPHEIKQVGFAGMGEPLLHKRLPYMIEQLKLKCNIERVTITTNGLALTHQLSESLISAGLDHIKISVNGISSENFRNNCGVNVDFDKYLDEIDYLYKHKGNAIVACKTMDSCIGDLSKLFFSIFSDKCDTMSIEKTVDVFREVTYDGIIQENILSRYDMRKERIRVCASPFFRLAVKADGTVSTCRLYNGLTHESFNILKCSLREIWESNERKEMLIGVLKENYIGLNKQCSDCSLRDDFAFESDILDDHIDDLYARIISERRRCE